MLLDRINGNLRWTSMKVKPSKSRNVSICRGKISYWKFIDEDEIPRVREKSVKSIGRWYRVDLSDKKKVELLRKDVAKELGRKDRSGLPGKLKLWCLQSGLFARLMWPLSVYQTTNILCGENGKSG